MYPYGATSALVPATIAQLRTEISDVPRLCVKPGQYEIVANPADGVATTFALRFQRAILGSLTVYFQVPPPQPNALPPRHQIIASDDVQNGWTTAVDAYGQPSVVFSSPPAAGTVVEVRYLVVAFTDDELATYMGDNQMTTLDLTLKKTHLAIIPAILSNQDRITIYKIGDRTDDTSRFTDAQMKLMDKLAAYVDNEAGDGPAASTGSSYGCGPTDWGAW